jgi:preprotein translocase subunit SecE
MIFNRFDMLRATRGVLAMTIIWAVIVFGVKFLG